MTYDVDVKDFATRKLQEMEDATVKIALLGQPGAGKSSLINKILGKNVFRVSPETDTTRGAEEHTCGDLVITDLPGYGTSMFPVEQWAEQFHPENYDLFLFVFSGKLHDSDGAMFKLLQQWRKERKHPYFVVRNKADTIWEDGKSEAELRKTISQDVAEKFGQEVDKVYFTSCRTLEGIEALKEDIFTSDIPAVKKDKMVAEFKATCLKDLENKRNACLNKLDYYCLAAAANGLNPLPGTDLVVDVGIIYDMAKTIRECFGIDDTKFEEYIRLFGPIVVENVTKFATKVGIIEVFKEEAGKTVGKQVGKRIPLLGQLIVATIEYYTIKYMGKTYIDRCCELGRKIMENNAKIIENG